MVTYLVARVTARLIARAGAGFISSFSLFLGRAPIMAKPISPEKMARMQQEGKGPLFFCVSPHAPSKVVD